MTEAEKLEALIKKAVENGFVGVEQSINTPKSYAEHLLDWPFGEYDLIFRKDFARALFGEQGFGGEFTGKYPNPHLDKRGGAQRGWQYHLQQAVISVDPIGYMYGVVFGD